MAALRKLVIENLRGSGPGFALQFEKNRTVTIVYGENGTGKSTICDAFELLGKGRIGSLEGRGLGQPTGYWASMGRQAADIRVRLESAGGSCEAKVVRAGVVSVSPEALRPAVEVFRRRQILEPIAASPADRYEAIKRFIDVTTVEAGEQTLRDLIKELNGRLNVASVRVAENLEEIERLWETAGRPDTNAMTWAQSEAARESASIEIEAKALDSLREAYRAIEAKSADCAAARESLEAARKAAEEAAARLRDQIQAGAGAANEILAVLEAAEPYLTTHPSPEVCPLCESADATADLKNRVQARLAGLHELRGARAQADSTANNKARASEKLAAVADALASAARSFETARKLSGVPSGTALPPDAAPEDSDAVAQWLADTARLPTAWESVRDARQASKQSLASLKKAVANWSENMKTAHEITALRPRLEAALKVMEEERRAFTDEVLSEISDEVGRLYEKVHPGEGLGKIALELDPKRRASLGIASEFHGTAAKPQGYFSDSHLDTLGLCILLALAAKERAAEKVLVLDDVLASADEPHVERVVDLLYSEAAKFRHCIVTTHYRPWRERLRWGAWKTGDCHFVELTRWSIADGITLTGSVPEIVRLRALVAAEPPDLQAICAKSGVILEATLDFLTRLYECKIPRRAGAPALGDLLQGIDKKLRDSLRVEVRRDGATPPVYESKPLGGLLSRLLVISHSRNLFGCHFNELSFHLLDSDALEFGQVVLELAETLVDLEEGWPKSNRSGSYWATSREARRLHPLVQPR